MDLGPHGQADHRTPGTDRRLKLAKMFNSIIDFLSIFIIVVSFLSVSSLVFGLFKPLYVFILSFIIATVIFNKFFRVSFHFDSKLKLFLLFLLILIASLFRIPPYHYLLGGQDEGVYVNMSKYFQKYGKILVQDRTLVLLEKNNFLKKVYYKDNFYRLSYPKNIYKEDKKEGIYLLGVYIKDLEKGQYVFQFYHLHPLWMAIFGRIFGDAGRIYSLTFFSLVSIIFFYLIVYELTKNNKYAFLAALVLAINPLHSFFSKFPVTEVMALSLTLGGLYYFIKFYQYKLVKFGVISVGLFSCFFFTRISGFMYVPFLYFLLLYIISDVDLKEKKCYISLLLSILFMFLLSVCYGLYFSYPYSTDIYRISFFKVFGLFWPQCLLILAISSFCFLVLIYFSDSLKRLVFMCLNFILNNLHIFFAFVFLIGIYKIYNLGFTTKYLKDSWLSLRWNIAGKNWSTFLYSSIVVSIEYISPSLFVLFLIGLFSFRKRNFVLKILLFFLLSFWSYISLLQFVVPYQYYYARYLLSEVVPYSILFVFLFVSDIKSRLRSLLSLVLIFLSIIYFVSFSVPQLKYENKVYKTNHFFYRLTSNIDANDLVILNNIGVQIRTPLIFYFDKYVFNFKDLVSDEFYRALQELSKIKFFGDIFLLSDEYLVQEELKYIDTIYYQYAFFERTNRIPVKIIQFNKDYYLYKVDRCVLESRIINKNKKIPLRSSRCITLLGFHADKCWTSGKALISFPRINLDQEKFLKISVYGWHPFEGNVSKIGLKVFINGKKLKFIQYKNKSYYFELPDITYIEKIKIVSNTFVPKELGINDDTRRLGIDIKTIEFLRNLP